MNMDRSLKEQNAQESIQNLRQMLKSIQPPRKSESEWTLFANELFLELENRRHTRRSPQRRWRRRSLFAPGPALAAALTMVIIAATVAVFQSDRLLPAPAVAVQILSVSGDVVLADGNRTINNPESLLSSPAAAGQTIRTKSGSSAMIRLDEHTGVMLTENTEVTILAANQRTHSFHVHRGEIIASVKKRTEKQSFVVRTANAECNIVGTVFSVAYHPREQQTELAVFKGAVEMISGREKKIERAMVLAGQMASVTAQTLHAAQILTASETPITDISLLHQTLAMARDSARATGLARLHSQPPNATAFVNGAIVGTSPLILRLPAGVLEIAFAMPDYTSFVDTVTINPGEATIVEAGLSPLPEVESKPRRIARVRPGSTPSKAKKDSSDFLNHPDYVEALIQITVGEYRKALALLDSLKENPIISLRQRTQVMQKIGQCYRSLGDFSRALHSLEGRLAKATNPNQRAAILWEIATLKANCLEDYAGAEKNLREYVKRYPDGAWFDQAYQKLAEVIYVQGRPGEAARVYEQHAQRAQNRSSLDKTYYELARIVRTDFGAYTRAAQWYDRLIEQFPESRYLEHALFELADCYRKTGDAQSAKRVHARFQKRFPEGRWETLSSR